MLKQASTADLKAKTVSRADGLIVIAMRTYPRQITKLERDEYVVDLSPDAALFRDFKDAERALGDHDQAFAEVRYEERFVLGSGALAELRRLARAAEERDVYLVCQCAMGQRCHRELLLMGARHAFDAPADLPRNAYPIFAKRLAEACPVEARTSGWPRP